MSVTYHTNKSYEGYDNVGDRFHSTISLNVLDEEATTSTVTCHVQRGQLIVVFVFEGYGGKVISQRIFKKKLYCCLSPKENL